MIVVDTNVFVIDLRYSRDPLFGINRRFLDRLAKLAESAPSGDDAATQSVETVTEKGSIAGTVACMSPE